MVVLSHNTAGVQQFVMQVLKQSLVLMFLALKILKDSNATDIIHIQLLKDTLPHYVLLWYFR